MDYITKWPNQCKIGGYLMGRQRQGHSQRGGQGVGAVNCMVFGGKEKAHDGWLAFVKSCGK